MDDRAQQTNPRASRRRSGGGADPELFTAARAARRRAHAPYSGFRVGAALRDDAGVIKSGANVENAAYPLGICAERVALRLWRAASGKPIARMAICTDTDAPTTPCGACRDAILRWAPHADIYLLSRAGIAGPHRAVDWLPSAREERGVRR